MSQLANSVLFIHLFHLDLCILINAFNHTPSLKHTLWQRAYMYFMPCDARVSCGAWRGRAEMCRAKLFHKIEIMPEPYCTSESLMQLLLVPHKQPSAGVSTAGTMTLALITALLRDSFLLQQTSNSFSTSRRSSFPYVVAEGALTQRVEKLQLMQIY